MVSDTALVFHTCISCGKSFSLVSRSSANVKAGYQGHIFQELAVLGGISVSQTHHFFSFCYFFFFFFRAEQEYTGRDG